MLESLIGQVKSVIVGNPAFDWNLKVMTLTGNNNNNGVRPSLLSHPHRTWPVRIMINSGA